jgi:elongation factor G
MKKYEINRLRNIAIIAHGKAGKTTLAEAMLYDGGVSDRLGRVDDGTSIMDFEPEEIKRSMTISSTPRETPTLSSRPRTASRR